MILAATLGSVCAGLAILIPVAGAFIALLFIGIMEVFK